MCDSVRSREPLDANGYFRLKETCGSMEVIGRVQSVRRMPSEGVTALFVREVINRSLSQPWASCGAPSRLCDLCRSAWMPSNSLVLARVRIDCE
jgi:hypothetical protein